MTPVRRWLVVGVAAALLVATPLLPRVLPVAASDLDARQVADLIASSSDVAWSGEARTRGTLSIPDTESFGGVARLLGEDTDLRVWWRDDERWRVDRIRTTGETGLIRDGGSLSRWNFESDRVTATPWSTVRLPDAVDLVPSELARRLLAGAEDDELSRLPGERVAGRGTVGLRLEPADERSTIERVDVWADRETGLPVRVEVDAAGTLPVLASTLTSLDVGEPDADVTAFRPPPGSDVRREDAIDLAAGANAFAPFLLPDPISGLSRRGEQDELGGVGVYGSGPTALVAVPLRPRTAERVREQLLDSASAERTPQGVALQVGPLSVLQSQGFLLAGTVTPTTLADAAVELTSQVRFR